MLGEGVDRSGGRLVRDADFEEAVEGSDDDDDTPWGQLESSISWRWRWLV